MDRPVHNFDCIIFDMDGTLTEAVLDFAAIRTEIGIAEGLGLLESINGMEPLARAAAHEILLRHELAAARMVGLAEGRILCWGRSLRRAWPRPF